MLTQPTQYKMNLPSDYDREIFKQGSLSDEKKTSAKSGKQIPQLGEQENQLVPPLIVESDIDKAFHTDMDEDRDLLDPLIIQSAKRLNMSITQAKETAARMNIYLCQMFGIEEVPTAQVSLQYVLRGPLISPEAEAGVSTNMQNLLNWYKLHIKKKNMK
jgi:hypothetical protein